MTRPMPSPGASRPAGGGAGSGYRPGAAYRPSSGGAGRPAQRPGSTPGSYRPGSAYQPGSGGMTRPSPSPGGGNRPGTGGGGAAGPGGSNRPGSGDYRPGAGGNRPGTGDYRPGPGGNRPGPGDYRPGAGGNRPGLGDNRPGPGGNRPGQGDYRPDAGGNRPGAGGNRPGAGGNRPGRPDYGDNLGVVNRPGINRPGGGWGGGWFGNNIVINNGWGGLRGWAGPGRWRFNSPFLGNWYRGSWGWNHFGGRFGPVGMGSWPGRWPIGFFPTWRHAGLVGWGLGAWANGWLYSGFTNPYIIAPVINTTVVANAPPVFVPDYSHPLDLTSIPPEPEGTEQDDSTFLAARDAFKSGEFARALSLTDLALQHYPNDPILHEFRALCLFALGRYDEAAAALYVVLTAGPGWDWATMVGLYPDVDTYTRQLRALEAAIKGNASVAATRFVLAYHYMVQEHVERAREQFGYAAQLQPRDKLAAQFAKALAAPSEAPSEVATGPARASETAGTHEPSPPPAALLGIWKARPMPDLSIELILREDGQFTWDVNTGGQADSISGDADYVDGVLTLTQADAPALVGKIVDLGEKQFGFELLGGSQAATVRFSR